MAKKKSGNNNKLPSDKDLRVSLWQVFQAPDVFTHFGRALIELNRLFAGVATAREQAAIPLSSFVIPTVNGRSVEYRVYVAYCAHPDVSVAVLKRVVKAATKAHSPVAVPFTFQIKKPISAEIISQMQQQQSAAASAAMSSLFASLFGGMAAAVTPVSPTPPAPPTEKPRSPINFSDN